MIKDIKDFFGLLDSSQKHKFLLLQLLVFLMAFFEVFAIASIGPFMALVGDISLLERSEYLSIIYFYFNFSDPYDFLFVSGVLVLLLLSLSTALSMLTTWRLSLFSFAIGTEISDRLYKYYLSENWLFHTKNNSSILIKHVSTETMRVTSQVILPFMQMNARIVLAVFIISGMIFYEPKIAFFSALIFSITYILLYKLVKSKLIKNSNDISCSSGIRFRLMNEGFGGIKDVIILNRQKKFIDDFKRSGITLSNANGNNIVLSQVPRYFMELLAFGGMIGLVLFLIKNNEGELGAVLPVLAIYGLAGFKLLPALQQIYGSVTIIKGNISAFHEIKEDLINSNVNGKSQENNEDYTPLSFNHKIELRNVSFTYPNKNTPALKDISLDIPVNSVVGFVGPSGSGKSTTIDLLLGLIEAQKGSFFVDGKLINTSNNKEWQKNIGFVPQSIFLTEGTIAENIAFGLTANEIDYGKINNAVNLASISDFISTLPDGLETKVGERGVQLSGGQRQRIGIARALYNDASVLIFDEATSALDGLTEKMIMESIDKISGNKTIIMIAHRLKTVENCSAIFYLEEGSLVQQGTYKELFEQNKNFRELALNA